MEQVIASSDGQPTTHAQGQRPTVGTKPRYVPPRITVLGTVTELTRGSGGDYGDECTSGRQPGDDE